MGCVCINVVTTVLDRVFSWRPKFEHQNLTRPQTETNYNLPKASERGDLQSLSEFGIILDTAHPVAVPAP